REPLCKSVTDKTLTATHLSYGGSFPGRPTGRWSNGFLILDFVGNLILQSASGETLPAANLPYGESFLDSPTGRWSNGLLIVDFVAIALSLPLLNPYLESSATFDHGANFAVAGSTALDYTFLATKGVYNPTTNLSLGDQLNWFKSHLNTICQTQTECQKHLSKALVFVGEIGGNDVYYPLIQGKSIQEIYTYLPYIIEAITNVVQEVIILGAVNVVVPGNFPMGCLPAGLTLVSGGDATAYDDMGCLNELNELALAHNNYLRESLAWLRLEFPHVAIIYADYYAAYQAILRHAASFGFDETSLLRSCCGIGGPYNYDDNRKCGSRDVPVCSNPEVIILGAVNVVVPGNFPMGCLPAGLTLVSGGDATAYDDMGCLNELNELALAHNNYLRESLAWLRLEFPHVAIIYADYYAAYQAILRHAASFGFDETSLLRSCCGIGGPYNYDDNRKCGSRDVPVCSNPVQYISWDGAHLTQEAYRHITTILFQDILGLPGIRYIK
ncbi:unnamed protein product, partial [Ilex paraguariensis]